jgi:hypothetical protein
MPPGAWEDHAHVAVAPAPDDEEEAIRAAKKKRNRRRMIFLAAACVLILGGGVVYALMVIFQTEEALYAAARKEYDEGNYVRAADQFTKLANKFSDSSRVPEYRFYATLSDLQAKSNDDIGSAFKGLNQLIAEQRTTEGGQKLLREKSVDLGQILIKVSKKVLNEATEDTNEDTLKEIDGTVKQVAAQYPASITPQETTEITDRVANARKVIAVGRERKAAHDQMREMAKKSGAQSIKSVYQFVRDKTPSIPGFDTHDDTKLILGGMYDEHLKTIKFVPPSTEAEAPGPRRAEDSEPSILLDPFVAGPQPPFVDDDKLLIAVARGVLYGLSPSNGQIKWAMRVGIDTAQLPVRLPPTVAHPGERLLVLSGDARLLTALNLGGTRLWERRLGSACLGRPVVVKNKAYVPTSDGQVHVIGLADGKDLGHWNFGQPLSVGGVHQDGTNLVYFPADDTCVYVIDVEKQQCELVLYTNHSAGSLRGEPLVIGDNVAGMASYLLLTQASGADETTLNPYELPIKDRHQVPVTMELQPRIEGWTWFSPFADSEKIVCLSDAARLGLFGIRQVRNPDDPLLFPLVPGQAGLDLTGFLKKGEGEQRSRALVAHVQGDDLWVLAHGRLQRLDVRLNRRLGPEALPRWKAPLELGSPLHAQQVFEMKQGAMLQQSLFLVSQPLGRPVVLATAIDPEGDENGRNGDGRLLWQRQLGMVCQGQPLLLDGEVLAMDRAGGLFRFKPADYVTEAGVRWLGAARDVGVAAGLERGGSEPPRLIQVDDKTAFAVANPTGTRLVVRRYQTPGNGGAPKVSEQELDLPGSRPAGNAAVVGESFLVPLEDGKLVMYKLPLEQRGTPIDQRPWGLRGSIAGARCHIVPLGTTGFLTTDGSSGITHWQIVNGNLQAIVPPGRSIDKGTVKLNDRIISAPLVLPRVKPADPLQVIVADSGKVLTLLTGDKLEPGQTWKMPGRITAGPFLHGSAVGCVVDQTTLVWVDPAKEQPLWSYRTDGQAIVGEPHQIDDLVVVCDEGGRYVGLDPATGTPAGKGYRLKAVVAPASTPVPFGKGRAFAPLTDGTMMLLSLDRLRAPKPADK